MKTKYRRLLSILISFTMLISLIPASTIVAWTAPSQVHVFQVPGGMRSFFLTPAGNSMQTGFYYLAPEAGMGNNEVTYCIDAEADAPNGNLYDFNDASVSNQAYMAGIQAIIQHGYPFRTNGLSDEDARYATQAAIHWLESYCLGGTEGWDYTLIDRVTAPGHEGALAFAKELFNYGVNQTVIHPRVTLSLPSVWININGTLECNVAVDEIDTDYWSVTFLPAGVSVVGGPSFTGDTNLTLRLTDPIAYQNAASHQLQVTSYSNRTTSNIHVFDISQSESDPSLQTMVAVSGNINPDPDFIELNDALGTYRIYKVTRTMDEGDVPEANAVFKLYPIAYPTLQDAITAGAPVGTITTGADGNGDCDVLLPLGQYYLDQISSAPGSYLMNPNHTIVSIDSPSPQRVGIFNEQGDGFIDILKRTSKNGVLTVEAGARFAVRNSAGTLVDTLVTDTNGHARSILLPYDVYTVTQTVAPPHTVLNTATLYFAVGVNGVGQVTHQDIDYGTLINLETKGTLSIHKVTNYTSQVPEANAGFQVYPSVYASYGAAVNDGAPTALLTTDANGNAQSGSLSYGTYVVHQFGAPAGTIPVSDRTVTIGDTNGADTHLNLVNELYKGDVEIKKYYAPESDPNNRTAEAGATFRIYPSSYASYADALANDPHAVDTCDSITTGADGIARSTHLLPYGTYICEQIPTAATANTFPVQPWIFTIGATNNQHLSFERVNTLYEQYLRIIKTDAQTGLVIPLAGATFRILAADQETILSDRTGKTDFTTDSTGQIDLNDMPLLVGTYYIKETKAPVGYTLNPNLVPFAVQMSDHGSSVVTVSMGKDFRTEEFANERQTCSLSVEKQGETLITASKVDAKDATGTLVTDGDGNALSVYDFYYDQRPMNGAVFSVYAGEKDIADINGVILYHANDFVGTMTTAPVTDGTGTKYIATMDDLPLGADGTAQYIVRETTAPLGQTLAANPLIFDFTYADQTISVMSQGKAMQDTKQDEAIAVEKQKEVMTRNSTTGNYETSVVAAQGIVFGLYTTNDILSPNGTVIVKKDSLVDLLITGKDGKASSTKDLPFGQYYAKELKVTEGVVWDKTSVWPLTVSPDTNGETTLVRAALNDGQPIVNRSIKGALEIYKIASDTNLPMVGVEFDVYDATGNLVDHLVTDVNGKARTKVLPYGEYTLIEMKTHIGYALGENKSFAIWRQPPLGFVYSDERLKIANQKMAEIQIYKVTEEEEIPMFNVVFGIFARDTQEEIARITTDQNGYGAAFVPTGEYFLKEISTWEGYAINPDVIDLSVTDYGEVYKFRLTNERTSLQVNKQSTEGEFLENMIFSVFRCDTGEIVPICYDAQNDVYIPASYADDYVGSLEAVSDTGKTGKDGGARILGLPSGLYKIQEVSAPPGYLLDSTPKQVELYPDSGSLHAAVVTLEDEKLPPKTGEMPNDTAWILFTTVFVALISGIGFLLLRRRKSVETVMPFGERREK